MRTCRGMGKGISIRRAMETLTETKSPRSEFMSGKPLPELPKEKPSQKKGKKKKSVVVAEASKEFSERLQGALESIIREDSKATSLVEVDGKQVAS